MELEWLGTGLGLQWNRAKLFQAHGVDFVVGSVHFAPDGIPYDGCAEDTQELVRLRGGVEPFWAAYFDECIEMVDATWQMISVVGHLDLPKLYAPLPGLPRGPGRGGQRNLPPPLHAAGDDRRAQPRAGREYLGAAKGRGDLSPSRDPAPGAGPGHPGGHRDGHPRPGRPGHGYAAGLEAVQAAGYRYYVSFSRGIPEKRSLPAGTRRSFRVLNLGMEILNHRFASEKRLEIPHLSFGGGFKA